MNVSCTLMSENFTWLTVFVLLDVVQQNPSWSPGALSTCPIYFLRNDQTSASAVIISWQPEMHSGTILLGYGLAFLLSYIELVPGEGWPSVFWWFFWIVLIFSGKFPKNVSACLHWKIVFIKLFVRVSSAHEAQGLPQPQWISACVKEWYLTHDDPQILQLFLDTLLWTGPKALEPQVNSTPRAWGEHVFFLYISLYYLQQEQNKA